MATTTAPPTTTVRRVPQDWTRNHARASGIFYLLTFVSSIAAVVYFLKPILDDAHYIVGPGQDTRVIIGCLLDMVNALTAVGSAVAVYPGRQAAEPGHGPRLRHLPHVRGCRRDDRCDQPARRRGTAPRPDRRRRRRARTRC